jgi:hypothetical protein
MALKSYLKKLGLAFFGMNLLIFKIDHIFYTRRNKTFRFNLHIPCGKTSQLSDSTIFDFVTFKFTFDQYLQNKNESISFIL